MTPSRDRMTEEFESSRRPSTEEDSARLSSRVLFVDHARALGGAERSLLLLLRHLDRARFTPHLATRPGRLADAARALGVAVHDVPLVRLRGQAAAPWRFARGVAALAWIIRRERIAVVSSNTMRASLYVAAAARLTRRPFVWHVRDIVAAGAYPRLMCACSRAAIAVSTAAAASLPCARKVRVIHNGVRPEDFQAGRSSEASRLRAAWGVPDGAVLIGQVARLAPWKGQRDVLAAAEIVLREFPDTYFAVIGGDIFGTASQYAHDLRSAVAQRGLAGRIVFTGHRDDVPAVLQALDVLVHASRDEPFGRILVEAGAAGRPVVAYASGAAGEIVVHEQTGLLVAPGDPAALAAGLMRIAGNRPLGEALGANARRHVAAHFDIRTLTREMEVVLQEVASVPAQTLPRCREGRREGFSDGI